MLSKIIRNFIAKRVAGRSDDGIMITLTDPKKVDFQAAMLEDLLMRNGIDPRAITSEAQLKSILNQIEAFEKKNLAENIKSGIRNTESAKVFDLEGKEIPRGSKIMGGKEVKGTSDRDRVRNEMKTKYGFTDERLDEIENTPVDEEMADRLIAETDLPPPGSRGGKDDIAAPVQSQEETMKNMMEAEIKAKLEKQNKDSVSRILERKNREDVYGIEDYDTTNMSEIKKEIIRTETKLGNLNPNSPDFRERAKPLIDKIEALKNKMRDDKADGGIMRLGFKDGMNRRTFLKLLGGAMSIPIIGKIFKPLKVGKTVTKVPIIKTDNVAGKPEWFDQLVNKVILEGDDVTKRFATGERQSIHQKTLKDGSVVRVTEDVDDGAIRVEYESEKNVFGEPVQMEYKKPLPDEGDPRPSAEFTTAESGPVGRVVGPDDVELDVDEVGGMSIKDLDSDVSILKEYATGQKPTMKELVQNIKRQKKASDITDDIDGAASDAVVRRQGDYDPSDYDDFARGGIARMLGE